MSQQTPSDIKVKRNQRFTWLFVIIATLLALWIVYSATQATIAASTRSSAPRMDDTAATDMPQTMPGMNH